MVHAFREGNAQTIARVIFKTSYRSLAHSLLLVVLCCTSLFSQYSLTFAGISTSTAYAVYKKPPNGLAIMMGAGVAGTLADLGYGWTTACKSQVSQWTSLREQLKQQKETQQ